MSRRTRMILPVLGALALATAACGPAGPTLAEPDLAPTTVPPAPTTPVTAPTTTSTSAPPAPRAVTIAFGGDVYGEAPIRGQLARGENPLDAVAPLLAPADVAVVNLETAVGSSGAPRDKEFVFQADPALLTALTAAGVDVVSVANNHSFDHGLEGFLETLDHVAGSGLLVAGGGHDA